MRIRRVTHARSDSGQSLVETALVLPLLLMLVLNAVNFAYFFVVALNLAAAPRSGVQYSVLGFLTPAALSVPDAGPSTANTSVSYLTYRDITGALSAPTSASVQVCSKILGFTGTGTAQKANCTSYGSATFPSVDADPEAPSFVLHRVDITYSFRPLIPGTPFGLTLLPSPICASSGGTITCTFHRQVSMRAID